MIPIAKAKWEVENPACTSLLIAWSEQVPQISMPGIQFQSKEEAEAFRTANKIPKKNWRYV